MKEKQLKPKLRKDTRPAFIDPQGRFNLKEFKRQERDLEELVEKNGLKDVMQDHGNFDE